MNEVYIKTISNDELHSLLKKSNLHAVGPVTDTTRPVYEKKLLKHYKEHNLSLNTGESLSEQQIRSMSNDELFNLLKERGLKPGPVTSSTRGLYEKKLINSLSNSSLSSSSVAAAAAATATSSVGASLAAADSVAELSDKQLIDLLKSNGLTFGPITQATRHLYENKLRKHLANGKPTSTTTATAEESAAPVVKQTNSILKRRSTDNISQLQVNVDPSTLSDNALFELLKAKGLNPGPVNKSTRSLYENKLITYYNANLSTASSGYASTMDSYTQDPEPMQLDSSDQQAPNTSSNSFSIFPNLRSLVNPSTYTSFFSSTPDHLQNQSATIHKSASRRSLDKIKSVRFEDDPTNDENNNDIYVLKDTVAEPKNQTVNNGNHNNTNSNSSNSQQFVPGSDSWAQFRRSLFSSSTNYNTSYLDKYAENLQNISNRRSLHDNRPAKSSYLSRPLIRNDHQAPTKYMQPRSQPQQQQQYPSSYYMTYRQTTNNAGLYSQQPDVSYYPVIIPPPKPTLRDYAARFLAFAVALIRKQLTSNRFIVLFIFFTLVAYLFINLVPSNKQNPIIDV